MKRVLALAGCVLLGSCGNQPTAGGGSDQPNSIDALVFRADGATPAAGAAARWVSGRWNSTDTGSDLDSVRYALATSVDSLGRLVLDRPDTGRWHLEIIDSAARQVFVAESAHGRIVLAPAASWSGVVTSTGASPEALGLAGTSRRAVLGPDKTFRLDWLPAGNYRMLAQWQDKRRELAFRHLEPGEDVQGDTLDGDSDEVSLIDLVGRPLRCALRGSFWPRSDTAAGKWFTSLDTTSKIHPYEFASDPLSALRLENDRPFLRWSFDLGSKTVVVDGVSFQPWAGVGLQVSPDSLGLDWSKVTSLRMLVRGRGFFRLQVNTAKIDSFPGWIHFGTVIATDTSWQWVEVPVASLSSSVPGYKQPSTWREASAGVNGILFYAMQTPSKLEIAEFRVRGTIAPRRP
ncbi:MAG: hypothetical protein H6686_04140 [Fibrobacteria bacterium]|nr:hypothetical protein [Fibrobacteria bacterium]